MIYNSILSKYTKLGGSFVGFLNRILVRFQYEKSQLHTIVYGGTGTGKTYFVRPYMKLYQDRDQDQHQNQDQNQNRNQDNRIIIIVCKEDRDWTHSETER